MYIDGKRILYKYIYYKSMFGNAIKIFTKHMGKQGFFSKLMNKDDRTVSSTNFFIIITTLIGLLLLFMPVFILTIEAWFNHTITTDLSGLAAYIGACASLFITVGLTKAWDNHSEMKKDIAKSQLTGSFDGSNDMIINEDM